MIPRPRPERFRLRRTMMFMNAQKPGLIKDAYIYGCDSIMLDLEDAVAAFFAVAAPPFLAAFAYSRLIFCFCMKRERGLLRSCGFSYRAL